MTRPQDNFNWEWSEFRLLVWVLCIFAVLIACLVVVILS